MTRWSVSTLRLQITKTVKRDRTEPLFELANLFIYGGLFTATSKWAAIVTEAQWVTPVSLQTQDFRCRSPLRSGPAGGRFKTGEVGQGLADRGEGRTVLNSQVPSNAWVLFPKPLIFSDYAVVTWLRLGGSQGKMPTLLLGCLPWRHLLQITEKLHYYNETFGLFPATVSHVSTFNQEYHRQVFA